MSPDSVCWLGGAWYTLPAISVKVRESLAGIPGDCISDMPAAAGMAQIYQTYTFLLCWVTWVQKN